MSAPARRLRPIIAIDGPAASGKSTVGRALAEKLGYVYIDTGALYRAAAWLAAREKITPDESSGLAAIIAATTITLTDERRVFVDGRDVTGEIRSEEIGGLASAFSALPEVRAALLGLQRRLGSTGGVVMDGRDIGTVVFSDAEVKVFLYASEEERSRRRWSELVDRGEVAEREEVSREMRLRDDRDRTRASAPLVPADDAVAIDSTGLTVDDVVARIAALVVQND
jgi:cytidylate kinase